MRFRYRQSNVRRLPPASEYCRARGNPQIVEHSSDNETVLGSSWKLGGPAEHLNDGSENCVCRLSFELYSPNVIERRSNTGLKTLTQTFC